MILKILIWYQTRSYLQQLALSLGGSTFAILALGGILRLLGVESIR